MTSIFSRILPSGTVVHRTLGSVPSTGIAMSGARNQMERRDTIHEYRSTSSDKQCHGLVRGIDYLRDPRLFKGMAFTLKERQLLGIHGLLPPCFKTQEEQVETVLKNVSRYDEPLNAYIYLMTLQDRNERLFYRAVSENVKLMLPIVYTPTVGLACQKYGLIYRRPRGIFISINDAGNVASILNNWPEPDVKAVVVTDGERILGLGDLGAYGMGIPVGKLALYTALAGIKPHHCLPVLLDVGTDNEALLQDPFYIGLKQKRVRGAKYDALIEEFMEAIVEKYGRNCLVQFEDFGNQNAFRLLSSYKDTHCTFNDDIQGTASVAVAGMIASMRITGMKLIDNTVFFLGAGEAALGIANLLVNAMVEEGATTEEAYAKIWLSDSKGLVVKSRTNGMIHEKVGFAKDYEQLTNLEQIIAEVKPSIIVGAAAAAGAFNEHVLRRMARINARPVIFALSNPTHKAECTAKQAYEYTNGTCVFASGSPFDAVEFQGMTYQPGQGNNAYIFPGVALAVIAGGMYVIPNRVFLIAAQALANLVEQSDLDVGRVYPPLESIREVSVHIALKILEYAYKNNLAGRHPEPKDKEKFVRSVMYDYRYPESLPKTYTWPGVVEQ